MTLRGSQSCSLCLETKDESVISNEGMTRLRGSNNNNDKGEERR